MIRDAGSVTPVGCTTGRVGMKMPSSQGRRTKRSITVTTTAPQLVDLHVDMGYTGKKLMQFKVTVDKEGQGRALILNNVLRDSNNEIRMTFNTTGIAAGLYRVRIEALPMSGPAIEEGWFLLDVK